MKQKFLQSLGPLRRTSSENVRYTPIANRYYTTSTASRQADSVSAAELRNGKAIFFTDQTRVTLMEEQLEFFDEVSEPGSGYRCIHVPNYHDFKTPLAAAIADSDNERRFINMLLQPINLLHYDAWLKSTATRFYEIDYELVKE